MLLAKKKIIIITAVICLAIAIGSGMYFLFKKQSPATETPSGRPPAGKKAEPAGTPTTNQTIKKAVKESKPEVCDELTGAGRDECYYIAVLNIRDAAQCSKISDEKFRAKCSNEINFADTIEKGDAKACLTIADSRLKEDCLRTKFRGTGKLEICKTYAEQTAVDLCESNVYSKMAFEAGRQDDCQAVKDEVLRFDCQTMVRNKPKDSDGDGLSDDYEIMILSSPFKADSDGDGCKDGDEITSRYSPIVRDTGPDCLKRPFKRE